MHEKDIKKSNKRKKKTRNVNDHGDEKLSFRSKWLPMVAI